MLTDLQEEWTARLLSGEGLLKFAPPDFPVLVCLCGSTRFADAYRQALRDETLAGKIVLSVGLLGHQEGLDMTGPVKAMLDELHLRKIDLASEVLFLNVGDYLGESSRRELVYARHRRKIIRFLEDHTENTHGCPGTPMNKFSE